MDFGCFLCGCPSLFSQFPILLIDSTSVKASEPKDKFKHWRNSWGISLSKALDLEYASFEQTFASARFCLRCQELVCHADFTVNAISKLNLKLNGIQELLTRMLRERFKILVARGVDKNDSHLLSIGKIIRTIDTKPDTNAYAENQIIVNDSRAKRLQRLQQLKRRQANIIKSRSRACKTLNRKSKSIIKGDTETKKIFNDDSYAKPGPLQDDEGENVPKLVLVDDGNCRKTRLCEQNESGKEELPPVSEDDDVGRGITDDANSDDADYFPEQETEHKSFSENESDDDFIPSPSVKKDLKRRSTRKRSKGTGRDKKSKESSASRSSSSTDQTSLTVPCPYCTRKYETEENLTRHIRCTHPNKRNNCVFCDVKFNDRRLYVYHLNKVHPDRKTRECQTCQKTFFFDFELQCHSRIHLKDSKSHNPSEHKKGSQDSESQHSSESKDGGIAAVYTCPVEECKLSFIDTAGLKAHLHYLHVTDFKCSFPGCEKRFGLQINLDVHFATHTQTTETETVCQDAPKIFRCFVCDKTCLTIDILQKHIGTEHRKKETLHKASKSQGTNSHEGFKCRICGKKCVDEVGLRKHYFIHDKKEGKETPFEFGCTECPRRYPTATKLTAHIKYVHRGTHKCEICEKVFLRRCGLRDHMVTHSDAREHTCEFCGRQYKKRNGLLSHVRIEHKKELGFPCSACNKVFGKPYLLRLHQVSKHGLIAKAQLLQMDTSN